MRRSVVHHENCDSLGANCADRNDARHRMAIANGVTREAAARDDHHPTKQSTNDFANPESPLGAYYAQAANRSRGGM